MKNAPNPGWKSGAMVTSPHPALQCARLIALALILPCVSSTKARAATPAPPTPTVIIVIGAEGAPEYGESFNKSADLWVDAAKRANAQFTLIGRDPLPEKPTASAPSPLPAAPATMPAYKTDKQRLQEKLAAETAEPARPLWLVFIGHGTFESNEAKFNLRDTDVSDAELAAWTKPIKRPLAVIDCSASSAPFLQKLSAPGRVIITATRTGAEINYSRLGEYLAASIADPTADLDKDGQTSLLEAFVAAAHRTKEFYDTEGRLMTEHALIDDNGDGQGTPAEWFQGIRVVRTAATGRGATRGPATPDGTLAHQWALVPSSQEQALSDAARAQRNSLETRIELLRTRKASLPEDSYYAQLDALFLQLADLYQPSNVNKPSPK